MSLKKILTFIQEIGSIMYVGGILSHIVIGIVLGSDNPETIYNVCVYKENSAYILIIPGLVLKILSDLSLYFIYTIKPNWLKVKIVLTAILAVNAFVFLVPMMPDLVQLASESIPTGKISKAFLDLEHTEKLVGMSNIIPLSLEIIFGSFKPKLGKERLKTDSVNH